MNGDLKRRDGELKRCDCELKRRDGKLKRRKGGLKCRDGKLKHRDDDLGFLHFKIHLREYVRERENEVGKWERKMGLSVFSVILFSDDLHVVTIGYL